MAKTVDLEYIGDPPILDEIAKYRIAEGLIDKRGAAVLRDADNQRLKAIKGITKRYVQQEYFGTSRDYTFGPHVFVVAVDYADANKILESESGHQFRLVSDVLQIVKPTTNVAMVDVAEGNFTDVFKAR